MAGISRPAKPYRVFYAAVALVLLTGAFAISMELANTKETVAGVSISSDLYDLLLALPDGHYEGEYKPSNIAFAKVRVKVKNKRIVSIELLETNKGRTREAKMIADRVVEKQSLDVELVSGATYTSKVVLKAIEYALAGSG